MLLRLIALTKGAVGLRSSRTFVIARSAVLEQYNQVSGREREVGRNGGEPDGGLLVRDLVELVALEVLRVAPALEERLQVMERVRLGVSVRKETEAHLGLAKASRLALEREHDLDDRSTHHRALLASGRLVAVLPPQDRQRELRVLRALVLASEVLPQPSHDDSCRGLFLRGLDLGGLAPALGFGVRDRLDGRRDALLRVLRGLVGERGERLCLRCEHEWLGARGERREELFLWRG